MVHSLFRTLGGICCLLLILIQGCAVRQQEPPAPFEPGRLVSADGRPLGQAETAARLAGAEYILIGESHDKPLDHEVQTNLLRLAAASGQKPLLGLEMLPHSRFEKELTAFAQGRLGLDELPAALDWKNTWGFDFALYRPIFAAAADCNLPVSGLNLDNESRKTVSRKGMQALSPKARSGLPKAVALPLPEQRLLLSDFFLTHSAMLAGGKAGELRTKAPENTPPGGGQALPSEAGSAAPVLPVTVQGVKNGKARPVDIPLSLRAPFERFLLIQSLWDATMAEQARRLRHKHGNTRPVIILAGGGHVTQGHGIAYRLRLLDPEAKVLLIMPFSGPGPKAAEADIFYYSPDSARPAAGRTGPRPGGPPQTASPQDGSPQAASAQAGPRRGYGLTFERRGERLLIKTVAGSSRAERAGLEPGDEIIAAAGRPLEGPQGLHQTARDAARQGKPLQLTVLRGGREVSVSLGAD